MTRVYPGDLAADETDWQQQVLAHIGLTEWMRIEIRDELDVVGPIAGQALARHGVVFPATAFPHAFVFDRIGGGAVLTGEGGDEVFGAQRITPVTALLRRRRPLSRELGAAVVDALSWRARRQRRAARADDPARARVWLRPPTRERVAALHAADALDAPLWWDAGVRAILRQRGLQTGLRNLRAVADASGVTLVHPLLEPAFVGAVAAWGGRFGPVGRTETMRRLFADVLPAGVLQRTSKARFNSAALNAHSLAFARDWNGTGVDPVLVDVEALRSNWLSEVPHPSTLPLLQSAWLANQ